MRREDAIFKLIIRASAYICLRIIVVFDDRVVREEWPERFLPKLNHEPAAYKCTGREKTDWWSGFQITYVERNLNRRV